MVDAEIVARCRLPLSSNPDINLRSLLYSQTLTVQKKNEVPLKFIPACIRPPRSFLSLTILALVRQTLWNNKQSDSVLQDSVYTPIFVPWWHSDRVCHPPRNPGLLALFHILILCNTSLCGATLCGKAAISIYINPFWLFSGYIFMIASFSWQKRKGFHLHSLNYSSIISPKIHHQTNSVHRNIILFCTKFGKSS